MAQNVGFEWQVGEDAYLTQAQAESNSLHPALRNTLSTRQRQTMAWSVRAVAAAIVALTLTSAVSLSPEQLARLVLWEGVEQTLAHEEAAWYTQRPGGFSDAYRDLIAPEVPEAWVTEWRTQWQTRIDENDFYTVRLLVAQKIDDLVQAQVLVTQPALDWSRLPTHRETRFSRVTDEGVWLRTLPPQPFWGDTQTLETDHLRFVFHAPDALAVDAVAGKLEEAFVAAYRLLALPLPPAHYKLTIVVSNDIIYTWTVLDNRIEITSPLLMPVTDQLSNADYLGRVAMHRLLYHAIHTDPETQGYDAMGGIVGMFKKDEVDDMHGMEGMDERERHFYHWRSELSTLRGWLRNELLPQPAPWRSEAKALFSAHLANRYPLTLEDLRERIRSEGAAGHSYPALSPHDALIWQYMVAESFYAFIRDTYGSHRIPQLLQGFGNHSRWSDLIPALFGVSEDVLVVKWNLYLNEEYQLDVNR